MTIQSLIERLEEGETGQPVEMDVLRVTGHNVLRVMRGAFPEYITEFNGVEVYRNEVSTSLDACRALHERVLPDWGWCITMDGGASVWDPEMIGTEKEKHFDVSVGKPPATAWLIAILKAFAAKEGE